ncbi:hypothetical protein SAICODRAFT_223939 [Saitoella complicata NRRL Y-17804]|uniref:uncharacterized protein n=1 Tax=Saitoella complicata (strain BCRC 22490 / CBS 7301 / JCM 7358 / NBRC 10748 / NRRL Y-17804) TaxID=698492 RepID=UPI0008681868|nr:uncharacterized protein SAICODRAFT_223939 [Saitoella complicata NRRL Y-17804]ODQ53718.1 hypothetical protein SAICODRAFT_223939 [Saitoella complicata NRRL Y-17804]
MSVHSSGKPLLGERPSYSPPPLDTDRTFMSLSPPPLDGYRWRDRPATPAPAHYLDPQHSRPHYHPRQQSLSHLLPDEDSGTPLEYRESREAAIARHRDSAGKGLTRLKFFLRTNFVIRHLVLIFSFIALYYQCRTMHVYLSTSYSPDWPENVTTWPTWIAIASTCLVVLLSGLGLCLYCCTPLESVYSGFRYIEKILNVIVGAILVILASALSYAKYRSPNSIFPFACNATQDDNQINFKNTCTMGDHSLNCVYFVACISMLAMVINAIDACTNVGEHGGSNRNTLYFCGMGDSGGDVCFACIAGCCQIAGSCQCC